MYIKSNNLTNSYALAANQVEELKGIDSDLAGTGRFKNLSHMHIFCF